MWSFLTSVFGIVFKVLLDLFLQKANTPDSFIEMEQTEEDRLRHERLRDYKNSFPGVRLPVLLPFLLVCLVCLAPLGGCVERRTVFVPPGVPVRLAQDLKSVSVVVRDADSGKMIEAKADLFKGLWILSDPDEWSIEDRAEFMNLRRNEDF